MQGQDFEGALRAAQSGDGDAFGALWRDVNPLLIRYLRVVGHDDPYDGACEVWAFVVRGLTTFRGDVDEWRAWLLAGTRRRAHDGTLRRAWGSPTGREVVLAPSAARLVRVLESDEVDRLEVDDLVPHDEADPGRRGLDETLRAMRELPLGQGEVLFLRLAAGLAADAVADLTGIDVADLDDVERRALERLGADRELLAWSLAAPASLAELADERVALASLARAHPATPGAGSTTARPMTAGSTTPPGTSPPRDIRGGTAGDRAAEAATGASATGSLRTRSWPAWRSRRTS